MSSTWLPPDGQFPFASSPSGYESAYARWIRDHASYLTLGQQTTQLGNIFRYALGVVFNMLIILPMLLMIALVLGRLHFVILTHRFYTITLTTIAIGLLSNLLPILLGYAGNQRDLFRSDVEVRNDRNRIVGRFVLGVIVAIAIVGVAYLVELCQSLFGRVVHYSWLEVLGALATGVGAIATLQKTMPLTTITQRLGRHGASFVYGAIGFGIILMGLILLVHFVVYGSPLQLLPPWLISLIGGFPEIFLYASATALVSAIIGWICYRNSRRAYLRDTVLSILLCLSPLVCLLLSVEPDKNTADIVKHARNQIGELTRPLFTLTAKEFGGEQVPDPYKDLLQELSARRNSLNDLIESRPVDMENARPGAVDLSPWAKNYYRTAQQFVCENYELAKVDDLDAFRLKQLIAMVDRRGIVQLAKAKLEKRPAVSDVGTSGEAVDIQRECMLEVLRQLARQAVSEGRHAVTIRSEDQLRKELENIVGDSDVKELLASFTKKFPSARYEKEFAEFVGRSDELAKTQIGIGTRKTSSALGTIPFFASTDTYDKRLLDSVREAAIEGLLDSLDSRTFAALESRHVPLPTEYQELLRTKIMLESLLREMRKKKNSELVDDSQLGDVSPETFGVPRAARSVLIERSLYPHLYAAEDHREALSALANLAHPPVLSEGDEETRMAAYRARPARIFEPDEVIRVAMAKYAIQPDGTQRFHPTDQAVAMIGTGRFGDLELLKEVRSGLSTQGYPIKHRLFLLAASLLLLVAFYLDFNALSIHGFYRDRLSEAFLLKSVSGQVAPESDVRLSELCQSGSIGPYPLVNAVVNLQGNRDLGLRDTRCDFYFFSKFYCGGDRTGYVETPLLESAYPNICVSTAMAVSAAAASPNMGRYTNDFAVMLMTLLNVRLGYWVPNPSMLQRNSRGEHGDVGAKFREIVKKEFNEQVIPRWNAIYGNVDCVRAANTANTPSTDTGLVGYAASGGGIRTASLNLGILQSLQREGIFQHIDYLSTVSGGGYTGCSLVTLMRGGMSEQPQAEAVLTTAQEHDPCRDSCNRARQWHLPYFYLIREMLSQVSDMTPWVNLTDGGHLENLGVMELLKRRCKYIIIGDGEAEPDSKKPVFNGLGILQRLAKTQLGIDIEIDLRDLQPAPSQPAESTGFSKRHWAIGRIIYPSDSEPEYGYLLYIKSSLTGDEPISIGEYQARHTQFPHESTTDQFFDGDQFEAYRLLGQHSGSAAAIALRERVAGNNLNEFGNFESAMKNLFEEGLSGGQQRGST